MSNLESMVFVIAFIMFLIVVLICIAYEWITLESRFKKNDKEFLELLKKMLDESRNEE